MKCYRREVLGEVRLYGELHRTFVPVLAAGRGFRVGEITINHRARKFGQSKYGFTRFVKGFLDLLTVKFLTGYSQRPQHLLGTIGLSCFGVGAVWAAWLAFYWLVSRLGIGISPVALHERIAPLYAIGLLLVGAQFMSMGFLAELFIAYREPDQEPFSIAERTHEADKAAVK